MAKPEDVAMDLERLANSFSARNNFEPIVNHIKSMHPTCQQSLVGQLVLNTIRTLALAYKDGNFDDRNAYACRICHIMWEAAKKDRGDNAWADDNWIRLPMI